MRLPLLLASCLLASSVFAPAAEAQPTEQIRIEFKNNLSTDGFFFTPVWFAFQDGNNPSVGPLFDQFNVGEAADSLLTNTVTTDGVEQGALEALAEDGVVGGLVDAFANSGVPGNRQGVIFGDAIGPPPINPGETGAATIAPINPANYQYLTFASMLIPSNDTFIGNDNPSQLLVFNSDGSLADTDGDGRVVFEIFASDLFDAGTEENDGLGAAFSAVGGTATETVGGVIANTLADDLLSLVGAQTVAGNTITQADIDELFAGGPIATITISLVPEPASIGLLGLSVLGVVGRRRRV